MKTLWIGFALLAIAAYGRADDQSVKERLAERIEELNLTEDQEAKIAEIQKNFRPKVEEAVKELATFVKDEEEKALGVLTADQKTKLAEAKEERRERRAEGLSERVARLESLDLTDEEMTKIMEIRKEYRPKIAKAMEGLKGVLTDAQRTARDEALKAGKKHKEVLTSLNLSAVEKEKVEAVCTQVGAAVREEMAKIRDVLTASQEEKLTELKEERAERVRDRRAHRISNLNELNLTDDQKAKIAEIRTEFRPKIHEAGNKMRATIRMELEQIIAAIKG
jgi:Spy/CpxP family protein refolding chaperone